MSTRSILLFTDQKTTLRFYKHSDGYPTEVLPIIKETIENNSSVDKIENLLEQEGASLEESFKEKIQLEHFGDQGDLEWIYVVDLKAKRLNIYGGGYTGEAPQKHVRKGFADPLFYVEKLYEEYQEKEEENIQKSLDKIEKLGYLINTTNSLHFILKG